MTLEMNWPGDAAAVLKPYVSEKTHWIVEKHGEFQTYYYAHHLGGDKNKREKYKGKYYQACIDFCEKYDQVSFDPNYESFTLNSLNQWLKKYLLENPTVIIKESNF